MKPPATTELAPLAALLVVVGAAEWVEEEAGFAELEPAGVVAAGLEVVDDAGAAAPPGAPLPLICAFTSGEN